MADDGNVGTNTENVPGPYDFISDDKQLRAFILKHYGTGSAEFDATVVVGNMESIFRWVKSGDVPTTEKKRKLRVVEKEPKA